MLEYEVVINRIVVGTLTADDRLEGCKKAVLKFGSAESMLIRPRNVSSSLNWKSP